jgi:sarcosine oxidase subunit gamma
LIPTAFVCKAEAMTDLHATLVPRAPFAGLQIIPSAGAGLVVRDRDGLGLATVLARKGKGDELTQRVRECFGLELPQGPLRASAGDIAFVATGPAAWLAAHQGGSDGFVKSLQASVGDLASIAEQSDGYAVLNLSGPNVRQALCKLLPIDLHPRAFRIGDAAATVAAHIGAALWRLEDAADGAAVFEVAIFRSLAESFWCALSESAAEFGFRVVGR